MSSTIIHCLHLSDFHVGKDNYGQRCLFSYILEEIRAKMLEGVNPDLVFITGDIANKGLTSEYTEFIDYFIYPLMDLIKDERLERIYIIPGNHDVDRLKARAIQKRNVLWSIPEFLDPTDQGLSEREGLLQRFKAFTDSDLSSRSGWIQSASGAFTTRLDTHGCSVGILGINTAWLCEDDKDKNHLSPGKGIIESGLKAIKDCDIRFVLGHHPIDWFLDEEQESIRSLFGKNGVIYFHGHLHRNQSRHEEGAGYSFMTIQSGACFQAREDEQWINRLLWCHLNITERKIIIEPRCWSRTNQEWSIDGSALPERYRRAGTDQWEYSLPSPQGERTMNNNSKELQLPKGWIHINEEFLSQYRYNISTKHILRYFDGHFPSWEDALSDDVPQRECVSELEATLNEFRKNQDLAVMLLIGPGGEGKSTILRQVLCNLAVRSGAWNVIWHDDSETPLPIGYLRSLPRSEASWLIASDDAEAIAEDVFNAVKALRTGSRKNFQFLLCSRDTDWITSKANHFPWRQYATYYEKRLRGLDIEDAQLIVQAWSRYGKQGLGELGNAEVDLKKAAEKLVAEAKSEKYVQEGAFLGAMLRVRLGEGLKDHIELLLRRLEKRKIPGGRTLMDAFGYIAALHAENIMILSKVVLAGVLNCQPRDIKQKVLGPLGEEAAVAVAGEYILTRHRAIAEAAVKILDKKIGVDFEEVYVDLLQTARRLYISGETVPDKGQWGFLSTHFFDKGDKANKLLGIRLARISHMLEPEDPYFIVHLSRLLREDDQPDESIRLFHEAPKDAVRNRRPYYYEWATAEGFNNRYGIGAWLAGIALSDRAEKTLPEKKTAAICLNGISIAFAELFDRHSDPIFLTSSSAAAQLALILNSEGGFLKSERDIVQNLQRARAAGIEDVDILAALQRLRNGITAAWEQREEDLQTWVPASDELTFVGLATLFKIRARETVTTQSGE